jgi:hypothetical protein
MEVWPWLLDEEVDGIPVGTAPVVDVLVGIEVVNVLEVVATVGTMVGARDVVGPLGTPSPSTRATSAQFVKTSLQHNRFP